MNKIEWYILYSTISSAAMAAKYGDLVGILCLALFILFLIIIIQTELIVQNSMKVKESCDVIDKLLKANETLIDTCEKYSKRSAEEAKINAKRVTEYLKNYYDGTGIETFVVNGKNILIGNEDHLVKLDVGLFLKDQVAALEKAYLEWKSNGSRESHN